MTSLPPLRPRLDRLDLTEATWRGRAIRYVAIYLALALLLVGARYLTQDIRPALRVVQDQEAKLLTQRNDLAVGVQTLENPQRIRDWAFANGMIRFAEAPKESQAILPLPPPGQEALPASPEIAPPTSPDSPTSPSISAQPASPETSSSPAPSASPAQISPAQPRNDVPDNTVEVRTQWR
ncbi:hypothetical protein [Deinococcus marmoris]|uniref:Cell division protein FtsL n=1 Tax=Deinococcus marmoris TaxID=249408 RepID=A0A1U7NYG1_9DEIO|nr:hypothetical protein [Deinococcus marmoris]OLV17961.1 Cell division protein FtsL [Deinococcus marmoris]